MRKTLQAALLALILAGGAFADIQITAGNTPGGENVLFNTASDVIGPALTVSGHISGTTQQVDVTAFEDLIVNNSGGGQATISSNDNNGFTSAMIELVNPTNTFTQIVFALSGFSCRTCSDVTFDISAVDGFGNVFSAPFTLPSGNTFYTALAVSGQDIQTIKVAAETGSFDTLKQLRITAGTETSVVPEPQSIALLGTVLLGVAVAARKRWLKA